jgi:hypothetical protein
MVTVAISRQANSSISRKSKTSRCSSGNADSSRLMVRSSSRRIEVLSGSGVVVIMACRPVHHVAPVAAQWRAVAAYLWSNDNVSRFRVAMLHIEASQRVKSAKAP